MQPSVINIKGQKNNFGVSLENNSQLLYCGRQCNMGGWKLPMSKWHNPFKVTNLGIEKCLLLYEEYVRADQELMGSLDELTDKILACFCSPSPCHCDVLVKLWNEKRNL